MGIFDGLASALAGLLGIGTDVAGFILGFIVIIVLLIVLSWALGMEHLSGPGLLVVGAIGFVFDVLVGWFPAWTVIFIVVLIALVLSRPFSMGSEGM